MRGEGIMRARFHKSNETHDARLSPLQAVDGPYNKQQRVLLWSLAELGLNRADSSP